jgi:hypothetical protein
MLEKKKKGVWKEKDAGKTWRKKGIRRRREEKRRRNRGK